MTVTLDFQPQHLCLTVADDGRGFDPNRAPKHKGDRHIGLVNMRERAAVIGGQMDVWSKPGQGTRVMLRVGLEAA